MRTAFGFETNPAAKSVKPAEEVRKALTFEPPDMTTHVPVGSTAMEFALGPNSDCELSRSVPPF
jgi:hypothetical protein